MRGLRGWPILFVVVVAAPVVRGPAGGQALRGVGAWPRLPERLAVAGATGLAALSIDGGRAPLPAVGADGELFLRAGAEPTAAEAGALQIAVHRHIADEA